MALRQRRWAERARLQLIIILGGKCAWCGHTEDLEIDCINPQGDKHHKMEWSWRVSFYRKQVKQNNAQLLCATCHPKKSAKELPS